MALTVTAKKTQLGAPYYRAKKLLDYLASSLGLNLTYEPIDHNQDSAFSTPFEYRRSALVLDATGERIGIVGEYKKNVSKAFKLPAYSAGFEIESIKLFEAVQRLGNSYTPLSRYPSTERDICFQVKNDVSYGQIVDAATAVLKDVELETSLVPVDIYQPEAGTTKNVTIRLRLTSHSKTLTADEVNLVVEGTSQNVVAQLGAIIV